ncbi:NAD(P)-dependent oxidoreductase [Xylophilus sp. GW821-FHT01B05]
MRIGFIGAGNMGLPMAEHLLAGGHELTVFDLRKESAEPLLLSGARWAAQPRDVAQAADLVIASLPTPTVVEQVVCGDDGIAYAMVPGSCFIDTTTNDPAVAQRLEATLKARGIDMLEVPVTGGVVAAGAGTLVALVGGDKSTLERYRSVLDLFCGSLFHLGPVGAGNTAKVITNLLAMSNILIGAEGMILGRKAGLDLEILWKAIQASVGRSFALEFFFPNGILDGTFPVRFRLDLMAKDLGIVSRLGREMNVPMAIANLVEQYLVAARAQGLGAASNSEAVRILEQAAGVDLRIDGFKPGQSLSGR